MTFLFQQNLTFGAVLTTIFDHLPCFAISIVFRLCSIAFIATYLNYRVLFPIVVYLVLTLAYGYCRSYNNRTYDFPRFPMSFISIFMPVFFLKRTDKLNITNQTNQHRRARHVGSSLNLAGYLRGYFMIGNHSYQGTVVILALLKK